MELEIDLDPVRVARRLACAIVFFDAAYLLTRVAIVALGWAPTFTPLRLFDLGDETNFPSLFSAGLHLAASLLLAAQAQGERRSGGDWLPWAGLALIFLFFSFDEWLSLHEVLIKPTRRLLHTHGFLRYAWVVPYGLAALGVAAAYARFLLRLPARTRALFIVSGAVFVAGALGCEMIGGKLEELYGRGSPQYWAEVFVEETLEMTGMTTFIYAILAHARAVKNGLSVRFLLDKRR